MFMPPNGSLFNADGRHDFTAAPPPIHDEMFKPFEVEGIPTLERADLRNPEELALWALMCLPGSESSGAVMLMMESSLRAISQRLADCGFIIDPDRVRVRYVVPGPNATIWDNGAGHWEPIPDDERPAVIAALKQRMRDWGLMVPGDLMQELADAQQEIADLRAALSQTEAADND